MLQVMFELTLSRSFANSFQLASQPAVNDSKILDKLLDAYQQLAGAMPNFSRVQRRFESDSSYPELLAMFYSDILEFHREAYKIFRRNG